MKHLVGIDPGKTSGWAIVTVALSPRLKAYGQEVIDFDSTCTAVLRGALEAARVGRCVVAIEEQFIGVNKRSGIVLSQNAGRWIEAAAELGCTPTMVNPTTWHAAELGFTSPSAALKKAAIGKVKGLYRVVVPDHTADAILIARWCAISVFSGKL